MTVHQADRRLQLRLTLALVAAFVLGLPFLLLALLVRANWDPLIRLDTAVADGLHGYAVRHGWVVDLMQAVSFVVGPFVLRPLVTLLAVALLVRRRFRLAGWVLVTLWGGALLGVVLKLVVGRARPDLLDAVATEGGRSFPSGHALGATVACGLLALVLTAAVPRRWRAPIRAAAVLTVLAVCLARVTLGVHYLTDVTAGVVLGVCWLAITAAVFHAWRRDVGMPAGPATEVEPELGGGTPEPTVSDDDPDPIPSGGRPEPSGASARPDRTAG